MEQGSKFKEMLGSLQIALESYPEHRKGKNTQYTLIDAGLSAFSVFYMQSPSFLLWQQDRLHRKKSEEVKRIQLHTIA